MKGFQQRVLNLIARIPKGRVVSYGQIAAALGEPGKARMVGWAMHACTEDLPWFRVLNSQGRSSLTGEGLALQRQLLAAEGIEFYEQGRVDLELYSWHIRVENADRAT
jgi:methylated-DNA-protein-cysteine methyltransferase-like protein